MKIKRTGGNWDPKDWPIYFTATNPEQLERSPCDNVLLAVNEIEHKEHERILLDLVANRRVLIDSGVFNLAMEHAKAHNVSHNVGLGMAPDEIDGFKELFDQYVDIVGRLGQQAWGYVEIDQGGRENKIKTRARLEDLGMVPIPVYHPLNDGWDYFDYLAERYDRICFGNVVNADMVTRKRLVATAWERRRKYPNLWIHLLGLTPSELTVAFPMNSCDSSTWIASLRWALIKTNVATAAFGDLGLPFAYEYQEDHRKDPGSGWAESYTKALKMCGFEALMVGRTMKVIANEQKQVLGANIGMFDERSADLGDVSKRKVASLAKRARPKGLPEKPAPPPVQGKGHDRGKARRSRG